MLQEYRISRKEKLILRVRFGQRDTFVRVPQIAAALASEQRNAKTLQSLSPAQRNPVKAPRSLLAGRYQGAQYFVESTVPGSAIGPSVRTAGLLPFIEQIQDLLDQLNPAPAATTPRVLDEARYETEVSKPLRKIAQVVPDEKKLASLAAYFGERLAGVLLPVGLTHGDFSASNIFHEKHRLISLIDWESSRADGLPVIDAIALVDSLERLQSGERVGKTIPRLAAGQFHSDVAKQFLMARYERWSIDPALHEALVYLKWLHHIAYLTDFWLVYDERALDLFVTPVVESIVARR
jgi:aminoglycoside phosphotransferase (APT) family kinase protein